MSNITQLVNVEKNMTTLKKSVHAPTDIAFSKLDKGILDNLLKPENKTKLTDLLNHHVVEGKINFKDLKDGEKLKTVNGKELLVHVKDGHTTVDGAKIQGHDVQATNGIIHSLETVMFKN
jgi:uncharacterized surface protein with fasciclin (FAS1) repeats